MENISFNIIETKKYSIFDHYKEKRKINILWIPRSSGRWKTRCTKLLDLSLISRFHIRFLLCKFQLDVPHKKRSDSSEIDFIDPPHSCITTNVEQDHHKLSVALICQDILSLVNKDPSMKVSIIISHIRITYNYTPSYKKAWIARTKAVEQVFGNWEDSYKELPRFL